MRFLMTLIIFTFMLKSIGAYDMVEAKARLDQYKSAVSSNININISIKNRVALNKIFFAKKKGLVNYIISKLGAVKSYEVKLARYQAQLDALS